MNKQQKPTGKVTAGRLKAVRDSLVKEIKNKSRYANSYRFQMGGISKSQQEKINQVNASRVEDERRVAKHNEILKKSSKKK